MKPEKKNPSLSRRALGLAWRNPRMVQTLLREEYRKKLGIGLDRRFGNGRSAPPVSLSLNLTRRCNLKCLMCEQHRHSQEKAGLSWYDPGRELPLAAWVNLLDQAARFRPRLYLTGGEPTLYRQFPELVAAAKVRGFLVHLQTNGTRLKELAEFLVSAGVEMVTVSLDGPAEVHDRIRGQQGAFGLTREGLEALVEARRRRARPGPLNLLNSVISRANLEVLEEMAPLALELGADILQLQHTIFTTRERVLRHNRAFSPELAQAAGFHLIPPSIPEGEYYESEITSQDLPRLRAGLEGARAAAGPRLQLMLMPNLPAELLEAYYLDLDHPFPRVCKSPWKSCRILPDGTVSPCLHVTVGNIAAQPLKEIWNGPGMQGFRRTISGRLFPGCARCCNRSFTS